MAPILGRRQWLALTAAPFVPGRTLLAQAERSARESRIQRIIQAYSDQGDHRTATAVDRVSGEWLRDQANASGVEASLEPFPVNRVDPISAAATIGGRRVEGLPLFDAAFTGAPGVTGRCGALDSDAPIGVTDTLVNAAAAGALGAARRQGRHQAIICVTRGTRPGLCPSNADFFLEPFWPPVLQVAAAHSEWLLDQAARGVDATVVAHVRRTAATAVNVTATLAGRDRSLPPLVIMTPRSGWYSCASERGGGIAVWLELLRELSRAKLPRDVLFVASSGHELGHLGINRFVERRAGIVPQSLAWIHLGANIGAAHGIPVTPDANAVNAIPLSAALPLTRGNTIQASDDMMQGRLEHAMQAHDLRVGVRTPHHRVPGGEAEVVHRGGGRYVSVIGDNALFHNPADRGAAASDTRVIARFAAAFAGLARELVANPAR
jgi:hypothetical protein